MRRIHFNFFIYLYFKYKLFIKILLEMVIINLKISDKNQFLNETSSDCPIDKLIKDLVISNF